MRVHVKFFAIFREKRGVGDEWKEIAPQTTVEQLWRAYAAANRWNTEIRAAYAVNQKLVPPEYVLRDGDEVAFLPPVSGGAQGSTTRSTRRTKPLKKTPNKAKKKTRNAQPPSAPAVAITRRPLNLGALVNRVALPGAGAIITFSGVVRDNANGRAVDHLEYEAYPEMAEQTLRDIVAEIHTRWPDAHVAMAHRIGKLKIGAASLVIAVAAPHRAEAYAASRYAIERVKAILPVWKKEFTRDGDYWVEGPLAGEQSPADAEAVVGNGCETDKR